MKNGLEIRDEEILLLELCRISFSKDQITKIIASAGKVNDWGYFTNLSNDHGIASLVCDNIEKLGLSEAVPSAQMRFLRNARMLSLSRNAFLLSAAGDMLRKYDSEGIKVVLLKGLALEQTIYGNRGLRQMTDLDILVNRSDFHTAWKILTNDGYEQTPVKSGFHKPIIEWTGKHLPALLKNGISIDLHIDLFGAKRKQLTEDLMSRAVEIKVENEKAYVPDPRMFFLYLVRHLYQHENNGESQLRLYTDLIVLLGNYRNEILCHELIEDASRAGLSEVVARKLELLRDLWAMTFPVWINDFIDKWSNRETIGSFIHFLRSPAGNKAISPGKVYRSMIRDVPGIHRKLLFLLGDLFPTIAFMKKRYGCKSSVSAVLLYPLRLGKLFWLVRR